MMPWALGQLAAEHLLTKARSRDAQALAVVCPLLRLLSLPCVQAAHGGLSSERLRVVVLPGFSLQCWITAMQLHGPIGQWPKHSECVVVETLQDEAEFPFVRFWMLRDALELRPRWHEEGGPVPLHHLLESIPFLLKQDDASVGDRAADERSTPLRM